MNPSIQLNPVKSSQIAAIGYDKDTQTLAIEFFGGKDKKTGDAKPNSIYHYNDFPDEEQAVFIVRKMACECVMDFSGCHGNDLRIRMLNPPHMS